MHVGEVDAALLEDRAVGDDARAAAAAAGPRPRVLAEERAAVGRLERRGDAVLQLAEEGRGATARSRTYLQAATLQRRQLGLETKAARGP